MMGWQIGDLAVCVDTVPQAGDYARDPNLIDGHVYIVAAVLFGRGRTDRCSVGLVLVNMQPPHGRLGYCADRFRKILPDKHEQCEPEFVTLLKRSKRKVAA